MHLECEAELLGIEGDRRIHVVNDVAHLTVDVVSSLEFALPVRVGVFLFLPSRSNNGFTPNERESTQDYCHDPR